MRGSWRVPIVGNDYVCSGQPQPLAWGGEL